MQGSFKIQPHSFGTKANNQSGTTRERKRRPKIEMDSKEAKQQPCTLFC